ncbi:NADH-quinone oxidoreductase subunit J [Parvularcula dongshanensis]|uniref:NADH-quinone oxidoreductase subunit J n=1 Tax=Parvularcula dongshanensis TaxID=1173995 RepID=A0A840I689_9PROT|nr:NADH-quinone oxidoreductase subunit J [Parvularcula dongshanensis]MBB4659773.1 NADH-quinone oxidoreductase subunit J [Parvularcula dongshanensis]
MSFVELAFNVFAVLTVGCGLGVILSRNPVHSVLFLILAFISTAGLFVLMGAEYLAFLLIVVYVGAVAVLFLFVVMMLDVDFAELRSGYAQYLPIGFVVAIVLTVEIGFIVASWQIPDEAMAVRQVPVVESVQVVEPGADNEVDQGDRVLQAPNNAEQLGMVLYTRYVHFFQIAGLILLVAMIGAIILTFRERRGVKTQDVGRQVGRKREEGVEVVSVPSRKGIQL